MDDLHWSKVPREPCLLKMGSSMVDRYLKIHAILTRLVVVSIQVRAKNSSIPCGVDVGHGPIRSTATSS